MNILQNKKVAEGFEIQLRDDGHWLFFESNGQYASICVESKFEKTAIVKRAITNWIDEELKR